MNALTFPLVLAALAGSLAGAQALTPARLPELGLLGGLASGGSAQVFVNAPQLLGPLGARLSLSRTRSAGGFDDDAPLEGGSASVGQLKQDGQVTGETFSLLTYGLDLTYDLGQPIPGVATSVYGGARYGQYASRLQRSDQFTEYASSAFGVATGTRANYLLTRTFSFVADLGVEVYLQGGPITRRDSGQGSEVFRPGEESYVSLSRALKRPAAVVRAMLGVKYSF
ncbi:hypothetical protein DKM44_08845 [Deinococcus irradiatisoli]|uniref:Outer membrane protein beta-barrel domain-containing protein n=1 Tax=Deinococcus irradiatisoli TaxID=2202254 RepID=A0A2Z3JED6_9DEIO|nr:hypothetical protein [Deinococcus irradiatisoli]AWN23325.1 hypothetical protein DKM44_08845 [Deinococcus irradiatisoli]